MEDYEEASHSPRPTAAWPPLRELYIIICSALPLDPGITQVSGMNLLLILI